MGIREGEGLGIWEGDRLGICDGGGLVIEEGGCIGDREGGGLGIGGRIGDWGEDRGLGRGKVAIDLKRYVDWRKEG